METGGARFFKCRSSDTSRELRGERDRRSLLSSSTAIQNSPDKRIRYRLDCRATFLPLDTQQQFVVKDRVIDGGVAMRRFQRVFYGFLVVPPKRKPGKVIPGRYSR